MPEIIEIEGNLVRSIKREVIEEHALDDFLEHLERRPPIDLLGLPRNRVVGLHWDESQNPTKTFNLAITMPPAIRLLPLALDYKIADIEPRLAMPWTLFVFGMRTDAVTPRGQDWAIDDVRFYFSRDEITGIKDNLIPALLPNVYSSATICWGDTGVPAAQSLMNRVDQTVNEFYQTRFNHAGDIRNNWPHYKNTYRQWAQETETIGKACYRDWPDWNDDRRKHFTLQDVLGIRTDVTAPIILPDGIPVIPVSPSFGRAEEWLKGLNKGQVNRLKGALDNLLADDPHFADAPAGVALLPGQGTAEDDD